MSQDHPTVGMIGVGAMGEALLTGILRGGHPAQRVMVSARRPERAAEVADAHGARAVGSRQAAGADVVVIAVKPRDVAGVLDEISAVMGPTSLVVCVAAGITTAFLESRLPEGVPVVRVMPNTPALVGQGMSAVSGGSHATDEHLAIVRDLLDGTGEVVEVAEYQQDAVTGVSGSGPAYVFLMAESLIDAGVTAGLPRPVASRLATQTLLGAATMLAEPDTHPGLLREQVTSPAGTTAAGLRVLEERGLRAAVAAAVEAAADRSAQLSGSD